MKKLKLFYNVSQALSQGRNKVNAKRTMDLLAYKQGFKVTKSKMNQVSKQWGWYFWIECETNPNLPPYIREVK